MRSVSRDLAGLLRVVLLVACACLAQPAIAAAATYTVGSNVNVSGACAGQNAESEQAVDTSGSTQYVYEIWMGCGGIGFSTSANGGTTWSRPITLPQSSGSGVSSWDPAVAVAPNGTVYAAYMVQQSGGGPQYPVVAASPDHGATFPQVTTLVPPQKKNFGDRDFIAVGPNGTVYLTWDYGPDRSQVKYICARTGSCSFSGGDLNVVMQTSTSGGKTFGAITPISPGFPDSGADSAPMVVEPNGRIDILYQADQVNPKTLNFGPGYSYFTASTDGGSTWSTPVRVGGAVGSMSAAEWWIDGDIGLDAAGNLYATWDTQGSSPATDVGWLSYSTDHGVTWSAPVQAPADTLNVPHVMEVTGAGAGVAYVGWLSNSNPSGYAQYLRSLFPVGGCRRRCRSRAASGRRPCGRGTRSGCRR
jgi:hypothetical protein